MSKTHLVLACVAMNLVLIGYVARTPKHAVLGRENVRVEIERDRTRAVATLSLDDELPEGEAPSSEVAMTAEENDRVARVESERSRAESRDLMRAHVVNSRSFRDHAVPAPLHPPLDSPSTEFQEDSERRRTTITPAPTVLTHVAVQTRRETGDPSRSAISPATQSPTAALASEDGFEPLMSDDSASTPAQISSSELALQPPVMIHAETGEASDEDQRIRAMRGWSAFQQFQKERVAQTLQQADR